MAAKHDRSRDDSREQHAGAGKMSAANKLADRRMYDLLVYGATGFTGQLVANYLAKNAPPSLRWGIAGRDEKKLQSIALELRGARAAAGQDSPLGVVIGSGTTIDNVAKAAKVVITTAGPYMLYGEVCHAPSVRKICRCIVPRF